MAGEFKKLVRKKKLKWPTQPDFSLSKWKAAWEDLKDKSTQDYGLFLAGEIFANLFDEIRQELSSLYQRAPHISKKQLLMSHCAISNRDRSIIERNENGSEQPLTLQTLTTPNNSMRDKVTLDEIAHVCVDGIQKALYFIINSKDDLKPNKNPIDILEFAGLESQLSQLYDIYEQYWQSLVWGDYNFICIDSEKKVFEVRQKKTTSEVAYEISQERKLKIARHSLGITVNQQTVQLFENDKYIHPHRSGKNKTFKTQSLKNADDFIQLINAQFRTRVFLLKESFPKHYFEEANNQSGFNLNELLEVFRLFILLARISLENYPNDCGFSNLKQLYMFCPTAKKATLIKSISRSTELSFDKTKSIIDFLTYKGGSNSDLWCQPLIETGKSEITYLVSSLASPVIDRIVEHWLVQLKIDLQDKGPAYEEKIVRVLNESLDNNTIVNDYEKGISKRIKLDSDEEEIDLLLRVGNCIIVGEAKSIVTTDSPISFYRTLQTLEKAATQIKRKSLFVENNMKEIFDDLGWTYKNSIQYEVIPLILNSSKIHVGFPISEIPVCDEDIISHYFSNNIVPLMSTFNNASTDHLVWYETYSNFTEFQDNLKEYLNFPPQITRSTKSLSYSTIRIPCINSESYKIAFTRLIADDVNLNDLLEATHRFPLKTIDDLQNKLSEIELTI